VYLSPASTGDEEGHCIVYEVNNDSDAENKEGYSLMYGDDEFVRRALPNHIRLVKMRTHLSSSRQYMTCVANRFQDRQRSPLTGMLQETIESAGVRLAARGSAGREPHPVSYQTCQALR
jgi:hypothetical protein